MAITLSLMLRIAPSCPRSFLWPFGSEGEGRDEENAGNTYSIARWCESEDIQAMFTTITAW